MLDVRDVHSFYGAAHVLYGVSLDARAGEIVALLGRNGMGKTTLLRSIMGLASPTVRQGSASPRPKRPLTISSGFTSTMNLVVSSSPEICAGEKP